jgi:hypothetical protein
VKDRIITVDMTGVGKRPRRRGRPAGMTFASEVEHPVWQCVVRHRRKLMRAGMQRNFNYYAVRDVIAELKKMKWYDGPDPDRYYDKLEARFYKALRQRGE